MYARRATGITAPSLLLRKEGDALLVPGTDAEDRPHSGTDPADRSLGL
jgi:hypothetical protein